jgi:hypothetical protein
LKRETIGQRLSFFALAAVMATPGSAQHGAGNGEWRFYGGDAGTTKYSPLQQIDASNVKDLKIVWEWKAQNFGKRSDFNWETTPNRGRGRAVYDGRLETRCGGDRCGHGRNVVDVSPG